MQPGLDAPHTGATRRGPTRSAAISRGHGRRRRGLKSVWRGERGRNAEAKRLAHEAVAIGEETDLLDAQGDAYADLAEVLLLGRDPADAAAALEQALARYQRKGNLASTQRVQTRLAQLQDAAHP